MFVLLLPVLRSRDPEDFELAAKGVLQQGGFSCTTLNLPRIAYDARGDDDRFFELLRERMELMREAHLIRREFFRKVMESGATPFLTQPRIRSGPERDLSPFFDLDKQTLLIGMVGLNELVQAHGGAEMHESDEAYRLGLRVISHMNLVAARLGEKYGMRFVLEQTPAESTAYRFARLDLRYHTPEAERFVKGDLSRGDVYYTNSTYLNVHAPMSPVERVKREGIFHPLISAGSLTHIWLGESEPSAESLADFVVKTFRWTQNDQIAFSPEFTTCNDCLKTSRGLQGTCSYCGSGDVDGITRITGYFTRVSSWNKGKRGELRDRFRSSRYYEATG